MKKRMVKLLLATLNSRWLNPTPCRYEFVGNVDAFSREDMEEAVAQDPERTLQSYLIAANSFKTCPISRIGVTAIEADGTYAENLQF